MTITFSSSLPVGSYDTVEVISGKESLNFAGSEYVVIQDEEISKAYQIRYQYHCSPFKKAVIYGDLLLIGHEGHFYLYDLKSRQNVLTLELSGYFSDLCIHNDLFYVADAGTLFCLNPKGGAIWRHTNLGIDGVNIEKFTENEVYGSGEWDPPGGWVDFVLDIKTGDKIKKDVG